jgi:hypothetical protein
MSGKWYGTTNPLIREDRIICSLCCEDLICSMGEYLFVTVHTSVNEGKIYDLRRRSYKF